jgi:hypothetical protein
MLPIAGLETCNIKLFKTVHIQVCKLCNIYIHIYIYIYDGPGSSVGIATGYGLEGPEIKSRWGRDFSHTSRPALGPTHPSVQCVRGLSWGLSGRGVVLIAHPF